MNARRAPKQVLNAGNRAPWEAGRRSLQICGRWSGG
jgi:hypothetical protein